MGNHTFSIVAYSGAWLTTIGGVWFLFEKVDETLAPDVRARLGDWLNNLNPRRSVRRWPSLFIALFDRTFGERHLSWFCLRRSAIASFLVTWIVGVLWMVFHPPDSLTLVPYALVLVTLGGVLFTIIPDFLSLLETRLVLEHLSGGGSAVVWLLVDAIATSILGGIVVLLYVVVNQGVAAAPKALWQLATFQTTISVGNTVVEHGNTPQTITASAYAMPLAPYFFATFLTSVWLWLFAAAGFLVRLLERLTIGMSAFRGIVDVRAKPGRSLGLAAVLLVTVLYLAAVPIYLALRAAG